MVKFSLGLHVMTNIYLSLVCLMNAATLRILVITQSIMIIFAPVIRMVPHCNIIRSYVNPLLLFLKHLGNLLNTFHLGNNTMILLLLMAIKNLLWIIIILENYYKLCLKKKTRCITSLTTLPGLVAHLLPLQVLNLIPVLT